MPIKRAIEEDFPIVEINRLAVPERNSFKPIYQMHKWFARRASCVFRAILLGALKPAGTNIMEEFYKDHSRDPDTNGKVVLDPFMGGGTTVVEALRLGCKVVGIDLNPVAWFIVKTEVEPVDMRELDEAFQRLANRIVPWSGKPLRQTLLELYKTAPPWTMEEVCGLPDSDVIYTFWVKSAVCTSPTCRKQVPLFSDYIIAAKSPSVRYYPDCKCPKCAADFDWEIEPAALVSDPKLMFHGNTYSGGIGRSNERWTYAHEDGGIYVCQGKSILKKDGKLKEGSPEWIHVLRQSQVKTGLLEAGHVCCPNCNAIVRPRVTTKKKKRKKVPLTVLLCPQTEDVFQWRGELAADAMVTSPAGFTFNPHKAHVADKGRFVCPHCGNNDAIIESIRSLPEDQLLAMHAYALQAYAPGCTPSNDPVKGEEQHDDFFSDKTESEEIENDDDEIGQSDTTYGGPFVPPTHNLVWKQSGKYYSRHAPADLLLYQQAEAAWQKNHKSLPYPKSEIPPGEKTKSGLLAHHYRYWHQMFNPRQLLALSTLLQFIAVEKNVKSRDLLLCAFSNTLETNNLFTRNIPSRRTPGGTAPAGVFARHDFQPKATLCEQNIWGTVSGNNTYISRMRALRQGIAFALRPYEGDFDADGKHCKREGLDPIPFHGEALLLSGDSRVEIDKSSPADLIVTDPPYADNVNYSELADFFYVWLRLLLKSDDAQFAPEYCPKTAEIVENKSRGLSLHDFEDGLTAVLRKCGEKVADAGLVIFTFHHAEGSSWESVLNSVCNANLVIEAIYPVHSEREASLHLQDNEAIAYDLIHVCRKRRQEDTRTKRSWAGLRQLVRQRAKEEVARIEAGRYGGRPLPPPDIRMVLIGKCLEVYSRHYGAVMDWNGEPFPLRSALQDIRMMVEQIVSKENPLPSELESVDALSQVWLLALSDKREVSVDTISKSTRGFFEVSDLTGHKPPLLRKGRVKGGRTYEVLTPLERLDGLRQILRGAESNAQQLALLAADDNTPIPFGPELVDLIHLLVGNAEQGERLDHLVERFRGQREQIRAALQYLKTRDPDRWLKSADKLLPFYDDLFAQTTAKKGTR
jgi:putative DNA methylase